MNVAQLETLVNTTVDSIRLLLKVKGGEYAGGEDRLHNFKRGAELTGTTPLQCLFVYLSKHYDSVATYVRKDATGKEQVLSEPIEGRLDDMINYCILAKALIAEGKLPVDTPEEKEPARPWVVPDRAEKIRCSVDGEIKDWYIFRPAGGVMYRAYHALNSPKRPIDCKLVSTNVGILHYSSYGVPQIG